MIAQETMLTCIFFSLKFLKLQTIFTKYEIRIFMNQRVIMFRIRFSCSNYRISQVKDGTELSTYACVYKIKKDVPD